VAARRFAVEIDTYADGTTRYTPVKRVLVFWCNLYAAEPIQCASFEQALECIERYRAAELRQKRVASKREEVHEPSPTV